MFSFNFLACLSLVFIFVSNGVVAVGFHFCFNWGGRWFSRLHQMGWLLVFTFVSIDVVVVFHFCFKWRVC